VRLSSGTRPTIPARGFGAASRRGESRIIGGRHRLRLAVALAIAACALTPAAGSAASPIVPWDGTNPFRCTIQDVGTGTDFPDPGADPFCVEFDKTQQNVTELGLIEFLAREPARVAAASTKCFYYQVDHWTGSIVQGQSPPLWHWDGRYFFDKARAVAGVHLERLSTPLFGPVTVSSQLVDLGAAEPLCAAKVDTPEERRRVYRRGAGG
jgi:hypothetical protein